jgi:hypothetical protein
MVYILESSARVSQGYLIKGITLFESEYSIEWSLL